MLVQYTLYTDVKAMIQQVYYPNDSSVEFFWITLGASCALLWVYNYIIRESVACTGGIAVLFPFVLLPSGGYDFSASTLDGVSG